MYTINFNCPSSRTDCNGLAKIQIWVAINGCRKTSYLDFKANPQTFKTELRSKSPNNVNVYCNGIRQKIDTFFLTQQNVTISDIMDFIKNGFVVKQTAYTVGQMVDDFMLMQSKRVDNEITIKTYNKYKSLIVKFYEVVDKNIAVVNVTNNHIVLFKQHLLSVYHYQNETLAGYMKKLKSIFEWAVVNEHLNRNPFGTIKIATKPKEVIALTAEEVQSIESINTIGRLDKVRDCFLFSCYTGLSFCDMATLSMDDIQTNGTVHYIKRNRAKTDVQYIIPLSDKAMYILNKYGFNLPVISNAKTNAYLKEIQTLAGIEKNLHFHLARHTALTLMLQNGIPIEIVSKIAGHTNIRQTQHYAKVMENTVLSYAANM